MTISYMTYPDFVLSIERDRSQNISRSHGLDDFFHLIFFNYEIKAVVQLSASFRPTQLQGCDNRPK